MYGNNIIMLQTVADGLKSLKEDVVFVGGSVAGLYVSDPAATDIRPTLDVDCVIELGSRLAYNKLEEKLRSIGFANDLSADAPICRWVYKGIKVDIMPDDESILGFSNIWYSEGINTKITKQLPNGTTIYVFRPEYYLASKFEAYKSRGSSDLRQSHDFEDIIYIMDNRPEIETDIANAGERVKNYLKQECTDLLNNRNLIEGIECALPYGSGSEGTDIIINLIKNIVAIP